MRTSFGVLGGGLLLLLLSCEGVFAQAPPAQGISAFRGLNQLEKQFGAANLRDIVEVRGFRGQAQPFAWEIVVFDPSTPYLLRTFQVTGSDAVNEGANTTHYPEKEPKGFFSVEAIKVDSIAAFNIANDEARKAKMGFDSLNYRLHAKEYSKEPVWILDLVNARGSLVGRVHLSASTGEVLRTVWIYRAQTQQGVPLVIDSALNHRRKPVIEGGEDEGVTPPPSGEPAPTEGGAPGPNGSGTTTAPAPAPSGNPFPPRNSGAGSDFSETRIPDAP